MNGKIRISKGNKKMPGIPNLNLPPVKTCVPQVPCAEDGCYALKAWRQYPNVREAWGANYELVMYDLDRFMIEWAEWLHKHKPAYFRVHSAGDFVSFEHYDRFMMMAGRNEQTKFLAFTKRYYPYEYEPLNVKVVWSMWPGLDLPNEWEKHPTAWLSEDERSPQDQPHIKCPGNCGDCGYQCWEKISADLPVVFDRH